MPIYEYRFTDTGKRFELAMSIAEMEHREKNRRIVHKGRKAKRVFSCNVPPPKTKHHLSRAMGCGRKNVKKNNQRLFKEFGITSSEAAYMPDGRLRMSGRKARNKMMRLTGNMDRDAGYGDYAGK